VKQYRVKLGAKLSLKQYDPDETGEYKKSAQGKNRAKAETAKLIAKLDGLPLHGLVELPLSRPGHLGGLGLH
jgi:hypothetical protein